MFRGLIKTRRVYVSGLVTLALNQHRCRPDYTIRLVTSQAIATMLSDRCELCVHSIRFDRIVPFFRRWLFVLERETKMFDAKRSFPRSSLESSTQKRYIFRAFRVKNVWDWLNFIHEWARFQRRSIPTIPIRFRLLVLERLQDFSIIRVMEEKFNGLESCNGLLDCQSYSRYPVYNAIRRLFLFGQRGCFCASCVKETLHYMCIYGHGKYKRRGLI